MKKRSVRDESVEETPSNKLLYQARGTVTTAASSALAIGAIAGLAGVSGWWLVYCAIGSTYAVIAAVALWPWLSHQGGKPRAPRRALQAR
jgi:hypothetical protein